MAAIDTEERPSGKFNYRSFIGFFERRTKKTIWEFVRARVFNRSDRLPNCSKLTTRAGSPSISHRQGQGIIFQDLAQTKEGACTCRSRRLGRLRQEKKRGERERERQRPFYSSQCLTTPWSGKCFFLLQTLAALLLRRSLPLLTSVTDDARVGGRVIFAKVH